MRFPAHDQLYGWFDVAQEDLPFRSKTDFLRTADKQRLIQLLFQCFDGLADRRLGDKKFTGSFGEA